MTSLAALKKGNSLDKLTKALQKSNTQNKADERYWQPEVDKAGNGFAIIRFLDAPHVDGEDGMPWAQMFSHGFQGPGGWYIENSLTTINKNDPVSDYNSKLWDSGVEANKEIARKQKRRLSYVSNILVVKDPVHPENEGKVFLYSYGKKIFDKVRAKINPSDEEIEAAKLEGINLEAANVFSFWDGVNFKLKIRKVEGYRNYDKSEFETTPSAVAGSDSEIEKIWKGAYSLKEVVATDKFKSYEDLEKRLNKVLGLDGSVPAPKTTAETAAAVEDNDPPFEPGKSPVKLPAAVSTTAEVSKAVTETPATEEDSAIDYFRKLADGND